MSSVDQTLRKARQVQQRYKKFMEKREENQKSMAQTFKKIDKAQQTLAQTKDTIANIDDLYTKMQKAFSDSIDNAIKLVQKSSPSSITVADPGFEPNNVNAMKVAQMLKDKKKILVLTGAGISAASGIPTFRGEDGFWRKQKVQIDPEQPAEKIDPQVILTNTFYSQYPHKTWEWLRNFYELKVKAKPNAGHIALAEIIENLRERGKEVCIVTQNIDNLHTQTKMKRLQKNKKMKDYEIFQIHGNILKIRCTECSKNDKKLQYQPFEAYVDILQMNKKIFCPKCQAPLRPHIMFFDQFYDEIFNHSQSVNAFMENTEAVVVIGTALQTGMANSIVSRALDKGTQIVEINPRCEIRKSAVWWMQDKSQAVLEQLKVQVIKK